MTKKATKTVIKPKKKPFRFLVLGGFSVLVISLTLGYIVSVSLDISNKYKEKDKLSNELVELKEEEQVLTIDVEKLKNPEYVARYLREKFLYSKDGEYIIKIPNEE